MATMLMAVQSAELTRSPQEPDPRCVSPRTAFLELRSSEALVWHR